jgi:hypothetical protein
MNIYIYIYIYIEREREREREREIDINRDKKTSNNSMLYISSSNSFSRFCSHLNKIIETSTIYHLKNNKVKKTPQKIAK